MVSPGEDPLSRPSAPIARSVINFFGESIPALPVGQDMRSCLSAKLFLQAVSLSDRLIPSSDIPLQLDLMTAKVYAFLITRQVAAAVTSLTNFFGSADLTDTAQIRGCMVPVTLRLLSCLVHHFNGDSLRTVSALYRLERSLESSNFTALEVTFAILRIQASLGDLDEVRRIVKKIESFGSTQNDIAEILLWQGVSENEVKMLLNMEISTPYALFLRGQYAEAADCWSAGNAGVALLYACAHNQAIGLMEKQVKSDPVSAGSVYGNLFSLYGFLSPSEAEYKKKLLEEVIRVYLPESK